MKRRTIPSKPWWQVPLLLLMCLLGGSSPTWAELDFSTSQAWISYQPSMDHPYITIDMLFYDANGKDSYFTHDKADDVHNGPAVWVDDEYVCSPDNELAWPGSGKGNSSGAEKACQTDGFYGNTYETDYCTIRFYNPYHKSGDYDHMRMKMCIYLKNWSAGSVHKIRLRGKWQVNDGASEWRDVTWTADPFPDIWTKPVSAHMTSYNTATLSGTLSGDFYGDYDTSVGLYTAATTVPTEYKSSGFSTVNTYPKETREYWITSFPVTRSDYMNPMTLPVQYSVPNGADDVPMMIYKWFNVQVPGFVYPYTVNFNLDNQWTRKGTVSWVPDSANSRCTEGTWTVRNKTTGNITSGLPYTVRSLEVTLDEYNTTNFIEVYFVPKGMSDLPQDLKKTVEAKATRNFSFSGVSATNSLSDKITLSWNHTAFADAPSKVYTIIVERKKGTSTDWSEITRIQVNDPNITSGSYDDTNVDNLMSYDYRLKTTVMDSIVISTTATGVLKGMTSITSFTASQGMYSNMVKLKWEANQVGSSTTYFTVSRRPLGSTKESDWAEIHSTSGVGVFYNCDDVTALPGNYYEYRVTPSIIIAGPNNTQEVVKGANAKTDGFSLSSGIVSGRITYGTGTAVGDVKVMLKTNEDIAGMRSIKLSGIGSGFSFNTTTDEIQSLFAKDFSFQMYLNPQTFGTSTTSTRQLLADVNQLFDIYMDYDQDNDRWEVGTWIYGLRYCPSGLYIYPNEWVHLSCVYKHDAKTTTIYLVKDGEITSANTVTTQQLVWTANALKSSSMSIGNYYDLRQDFGFQGNMDEFRFFTKALTEEEILRNYNHALVGNEKDLAIYYPFDEGIEGQTIAYDFSKTGGVPNGRHAKANVAVESTSKTPSPEQLSLMAYTDSVGNYTVQGVPFSGNGTNYIVTPQLGIHEFSPAYKTAYVSSNSLVHSGVDFDDVSSFPVSGHVYYSNTDYPVKGVSFTVDGTTCSRDGKIIETDEQGKFNISVPIGEHFIQAKLNGHEFVKNGRYPADPNNVGTRINFDRPISGLEFSDTTLVNFTGRVVGGDIEGNKPVGFGLSQNNIGKARIVLSPTNSDKYRLNIKPNPGGTTVDYVANDKTRFVPSQTDAIQSKAWRGAGQDQASKIFIETDSLTGEFSALLPPLYYTVDSVYISENKNSLLETLKTVDLTQPIISYKDSIEAAEGNGKYNYYNYNTKLLHTYHSHPVFNVLQVGRKDGSFGIDTYTIKDGDGELVIDDILKDGAYTYGYPIFKQLDTYTYEIEGYEEYINADNTAIHSTVPMADVVVSISNALSAEYAVYGEGNADGATPGSVYDLEPGKLKLDSLGKATYKWKAGMPNITPPYSRTLEIYYTIGEDTKPWSGNKLGGIILGSLPTGNNFVTAGPDQLDMILRDPPGSRSTAEWTTGTTVSKSHSEGGTWTCEIETKTTSYLGAKTDVGVGVVGVFKFESLEAVNNLEVGLKASTEGEDASTWSREVTATKTITTSDSEDYVGAQGDVFIGSSTNIIYGKARDVDFYRNRHAQDGEPKATLQLNDIITTGLDFKTEFAYTQNYIENVLIPGFQKMRNAKLQTVSNIGDSNPSNHPIYLTKLDANDQRFGSSNHDKEVWGDSASEGPSTDGPSYKMIRPDNAKADQNFQDSVEWCNNQIDIWKTYLAFNEQEKVQAFNQRTKDTPNYSFDGGTTVTNSIEKSESKGDTYDITVSAAAILGDRFGARFNETGVIWEISTETGGGWHLQTENNTQQTESFSYTLAEDGIDALTVDVYDYGAFGPIFRTRGGQTSNPYEGEVVTKYYRPGTTIMEATMQIEVPEINAVPHILSDVPTGTAANFTLELSNKSEISEDVTYRLFVIDETNTNGAELSIDGKVLTTGRLIKVPANQLLTKALQLRQTDQSVLEYDSIAIVLASDSQPEDIADTTYISALFVPSSSPVELAISTTTMNTQTGSSLDMTFSGFDRNYRGLKAFRLQYKKKGNANWTDIHEYITDSTSTLSTMQELLPKAGATVKYSFDLESFADGDYLFRVVSVASYGGKEVYRYSDELALVKDMQRPRPLGTPEPTDGVLDIGDELSITFNETILKGELTDVKNFLVTGVLNGAEVAHETALSLQGTETTAQTEAGISLANKDFSIDAWVRLNGEGTILSHGQGAQKLTVGTDSDGKLLVGIAGETYTSSNNVPTGKWAFLTMNYKNGDNGGKLSATVAYDAATDTLFDSRPVVTYTGNGPLSVGTGQSSTDGQSTAIHELLLWDEAHDIATALANRSKTKNPATRHLIGYWKMDEGEGTTIRDYARNRHMTMADETWYLNNVNKALDLNGSKYLSINTASLPNNDKYNDYAVEFWMRGGQQNGETQLLQMGDIGLWLDEQGQLQLTGKGAYLSTAEPNSQFSIPNSQLNDNAWHHVALNVLRLGSTAVYVDGNRQLTTAANNVGNIVGHELLLGARNDNGNYGNFFKGQIDEVRVWNATLNADQLLANRKVRLTGQEAGLSIYYPFEKTVLNSYNQLETIGISENACATEANANNPETMSYSDNAPALRTKPVETNVSFNFTASDNKIVIELDEDLDAAAIEGCTLHFTVRDVRDENGNYSVPTTWTAFVNRNELVWAEDALSIEQQAETQSSVTATIVNKGGRQQMWTISGMPSWLQASTEYGTTNPRAESQVTFTVTTAAPIGKHEATVYLKGSNGIETPLTINVKVTGNTPLWTVNAADYEETMNLIGSLYILDVPSEDSDDMVAAFINGECRGVAQPEYRQRFDGYFVTMDIYANASEADAPVEFKAYDASTGIIYPVVKTFTNGEATPITVTFEANSLLGRYPTPIKLTATDEVEQSIELAKGWNWISLGVKPEVFTVENVFAKANGKVEFLKSNTQVAEFDGEDWLSEITVMNNREMYAVQTNEALTLNVTGHRVNPADEPITVNNGWSWVAFNPLTVMSLADALAGMKPYDDEIIKGQRGVAYYDNYEWSGSLRQLSPGQGYKIFGKQARTFTYPAATAAPARATRSNYQFSTLNSQPSLFTPIDYHNYPANMVVIAQVVCGSEPVANAEVGIFAGDECREAAVTDDRGMIYVTVPGNEQTLLHFIIATDGKTMEAAETVTYENDAVCGTPRSPFVIDLGNATAISHLTLGAERSTIFDLQGRRVNSQIVKSSNRQMKGVYIINGQKMVK